MSHLTLWLLRQQRAFVFAFVLLAMSGVLYCRPAAAGYASIVIDASTGEVLNDVNADQINHPASLTKMMTLYLAFDAIEKGKLSWDQRLNVSSWASEKSPTKLGLEPGSGISVRDCVLGMIVLSANDAATVMAEGLGGSEENFARMMTAKARELGMSSTNFVNASGLPDEDQVTTARDLVKLAIALHDRFPREYPYFATRQFAFHGRTIMGHNRLMYRYEGMDGLKTGFTVASGFNLASSAARDGRRLYGVVMGGMSAPSRDRLMETLLDNGFAHRSTDPMLVAAAAGQNTRTARRLLAGAEHVVAALSPVSEAEAAPLPPSKVTQVAAAPAPVATIGWSIQVGAYAKQVQAEEAAKHAITLAGLRGHKPEVNQASSGADIYRARLGGFDTERQARAACNTLHKDGSVCVVIPPSKSGVRLARTRN